MTPSSLAHKQMLFQKAVSTEESQDTFAYAVYCFEQKETDPLWLAPALYLLEKQLFYTSYDAKLFALAGSLRFAIEDYSQAYVHFQKAKELDPQLALGNYWGRICLLLGEEGTRNEALKKVLLSDRIRLQKQGIIFLRQENFVAACAIFSQLFWADPTDSKVCYYLGKTYLALKQFSETLKILPPLKKAGHAFFLVGEALVRSLSKESLHASLQTWIETRQHPQAHYLAALLAEKEGKLDLMEGHIWSGLEKQPEHLGLLQKSIQICLRAGKKEQSEKYQKAFEVAQEKQKKKRLKKQRSLQEIRASEIGIKESNLLQLLEKGRLKSALELSKKMDPPQNFIFAALTQYFAGHPEKAQKTIQQVPFQYQDESVYLWKSIFAMGDPETFPSAEFDLKPLSWLEPGLIEVIRILGYYWAENFSKVKELLSSAPSPYLTHPLLIRFRIQEGFLKKTNEIPNFPVEPSQKDMERLPTPETLHNQGISLYRKAYQSQTIADWKAVCLFWRERFKDCSYWEFWKKQAEQEEVLEDPRFQKNFQTQFKMQMIQTILETAIQAIRMRLTLQERNEFITLLRFSPFPPAWVSLWIERLLEPMIAPFQQKLKETRAKLFRLQETKNIPEGYRILEQIEEEGIFFLQDLEGVDPYFSCSLLQEEFAEVLFQFAQFFLSEGDKHWWSGLFLLEQAELFAQNFSLLHQIKELQRDFDG